MAEVMVDVDDVLFPTMMSIHGLALAAGLHDGSVDPAWKGWEVYTLPDGSPCPPEVYWDLWSDFALSGGYTTTEPVAEAAWALRRLRWYGHKIHLVTARGFMEHSDDIRRWTKVWLDEFAMPYDSLSFTKDKPGEMRRQIQDGGSAWDYAIDDRAGNVAGLIDAEVEAYLLTHPHNRAVEGLPRVATVSDFADIIIREHG